MTTMINTTNQYGYVPYRAADVYKRCMQHQGYVNLASQPVEAEYAIVYDVVEAEQPIYLDELCRRLAPLYGFGRITDTLRIRIFRIVNGASYEGRKLLCCKWFVFTSDFENVIVRYRTEDGIHRRDIQNICAEELMQALILVLRNHRRLQEEDLLTIVTRELGFFRFGFNIRCLLIQALGKVLERGDAERKNGMVGITSKGMQYDYRMGDFDNVEIVSSGQIPQLLPAGVTLPPPIIDKDDLDVREVRENDAFLPSDESVAPLTWQKQKIASTYMELSNRAYVIALFLSMIPLPGLVRLYTGKYITAVIQFVLCAVFPPCLLWWFVDFLRVWLFSFKDKEGRPLKGYSRFYALLPIIVMLTLVLALS